MNNGFANDRLPGEGYVQSDKKQLPNTIASRTRPQRFNCL